MHLQKLHKINPNKDFQIKLHIQFRKEILKHKQQRQLNKKLTPTNRMPTITWFLIYFRDSYQIVLHIQLHKEKTMGRSRTDSNSLEQVISFSYLVLIK